MGDVSNMAHKLLERFKVLILLVEFIYELK